MRTGTILLVLAAAVAGCGGKDEELPAGPNTFKVMTQNLLTCWNPDLLGGAYATRIDLVFHTSAVQATSVEIVDRDETTATPAGDLHPSDHAGVVVGFTVAP